MREARGDTGAGRSCSWVHSLRTRRHEAACWMCLVGPGFPRRGPGDHGEPEAVNWVLVRPPHNPGPHITPIIPAMVAPHDGDSVYQGSA